MQIHPGHFSREGDSSYDENHVYLDQSEDEEEEGEKVGEIKPSRHGFKTNQLNVESIKERTG
jgi:hypothetical protein